jgi:hypothetical protein
MANFNSPGVLVTEQDLSQVITSSSTTTGAIAGEFASGPCLQPTLVSNEQELVDVFGKPTSSNYATFFTAANFLQYSNRLYVSRAVDERSNNASDSWTSANVQILNVDNYEDVILNGTYSTKYFAAKTPGSKFNGLQIRICSDKNKYFSTTQAAVDQSTGATLLLNGNTIPVGANTSANTTLIRFDSFIGGSKYSANLQIIADAGNDMVVDLYYPSGIVTVPIVSVTSNTVTTSAAGAAKLQSSASSSVTWKNKAQGVVNYNIRWASSTVDKLGNSIQNRPTTSSYVSDQGGSDDLMHVVVYDALGSVSGIKGSVLEVFPNVSKAVDARNDDGTSNYYQEVLKRNSKYVYSIKHYGTNWGTVSANTVFESKDNQIWNLVNGSDFAVGADDVVRAYDQFADKEKIAISLVLAGDAHKGSVAVAQRVLEISAADRKDCMSFISPLKLSDCLVTRDYKETDILKKLCNYGDPNSADYVISYPTSFAVMDSAWKYQFDKYWNTYRYVPLNGDIAGLVARTEYEKDAWWSPAGFNRGRVRGAIKLSWNPNQTQRDELYSNNINPVVAFPNEGIILYGDKTLQEKDSAFDRINVRRLFNVLERTISTAAKYSLFEFNDEFTRAQFVALVDPYLRDIKGRRGIYDYKIVCDSTNNTPQVIDTNRFIGSIYIKPARSINFIELNFVAVGSGVDFSTVTDRSGVSAII